MCAGPCVPLAPSLALRKVICRSLVTRVFIHSWLIQIIIISVLSHPYSFTMHLNRPEQPKSIDMEPPEVVIRLYFACFSTLRVRGALVTLFANLGLILASEVVGRSPNG